MESDRGVRKKIDKLTELLLSVSSQQNPSPAQLDSFRQQYAALPRAEKPALFENILRRLEVDRESLTGPLKAMLGAEEAEPAEWSRRLTGLRRKVESPRLRAFRRFINVPGGMKFLLDLRADVVAARDQTSIDLEPLDEEISHLFESWFQSGFLFLQEISRDSSFRQIRFLKEHDLVHPMADLEEIWHRLGQDRRCFALYHRAMPEEPVVFIEAALTHGIPRSIHEIIGGADESHRRSRQVNTAAFYSINNTQVGLAGIGLGKILVFGVVKAIQDSTREIRRFCTLSPIPGFWPRYLKPLLMGETKNFTMTPERLKRAFPEKTAGALLSRYEQLTGRKTAVLAEVLLELLDRPDWIEDPVYAKLLRWPLCELAYHYIAREKNRQGKPLNPVAGFHMGNGATVSLLNVHYAANRSERGVLDSCGLMVSYVYPMGWMQQFRRRARRLGL